MLDDDAEVEREIFPFAAHGDAERRPGPREQASDTGRGTGSRRRADDAVALAPVCPTIWATASREIETRPSGV